MTDKRTRQRELLEAARERLKARFEQDRANRPKRSIHTPEPIYDDVYFEGMKWLDSL